MRFLDYSNYKLTLLLSAQSPPENVVSANVGVTWISISWDSPSVDINIVSYIVTTASDSDEVTITVNGSETEVNVTGLQPATEHTLTVISVSEHGQMSVPSAPLIVMTLARPGMHIRIDVHVDHQILFYIYSTIST